MPLVYFITSFQFGRGPTQPTEPHRVHLKCAQISYQHQSGSLSWHEGIMPTAGAGPPLGHEAAPNRAVRRPKQLAICATAASPAKIGCNETRMLSLMPALRVNSGTPRRGRTKENRDASLYWSG